MEKILKKRIAMNGNQAISFKEYMEMALYHPKEGYYNKPNEKIGRNGDFYTSSNIGDVFGKVLANWFIYLFSEHDIPRHIIEIGGGTGKIAEVVLQELEDRFEGYENIAYTIIEESGYHQEQQKNRLSHLSGVSYMKSLDELDEIEGIVFSNELFDALPVYLVEKKQGRLYEIMVFWGEEGLAELAVPLENADILSYLETYELSLTDGQRIEVPVSMVSYYEKLCQKLKRGVAITIDYGYTNSELADPVHLHGSIRGYFQHRMIDNPLLHPGMMDLTAHIHWDSLKGTGERRGVETLSFLNQDKFLLSCGILSFLSESASRDPFSEDHKRNRAIRTLLEPGQISSHFQVLVQGKHLKQAPLFPIPIK